MISRRLVLASTAAIAVMISGDLVMPPPSQPASDNASNQQGIDGRLSPPNFKVSWLHDELRLAGHTFSQQHENRLRHSASRAFPSAAVKAEFVPLGMVPNYWHDVTLSLPTLLQNSLSGHVELTLNSVTLQTVSSDAESLKARIAMFAEQLPSTLEMRTDIIGIDDEFSVAEACTDAFKNFTVGEVGFEESSSVFRPSAFPRLERIAALAAGCPAASLQITGHTDSSGSEDWNTSLSLQRATAVANYLTTLGVETQRMLVSGAGSSVPLLSNATRYGRSKNRRIEIVFVVR